MPAKKMLATKTSTKKQHAAKKGRNSVTQDLIEGLGELVADLRAGRQLEKKYTVRRVSMNVVTRAYSAEEARATRRLLNASQPLFARFLGVSVQTVRAWEGGKAASHMACRFLDEIQLNPPYWKRRFAQSIAS